MTRNSEKWVLAGAVVVLLTAGLCLPFRQVRAQGGGAFDYYVSPTGSDSSGTGASTNPWATIAHASTQVEPGAVVHVAPGDYTGCFTTSTSGTSSAPITYISDTKWGAQLVGTSGSTWTNDGDYIVIQNLDVTGPGLNGIYTQGNATRIIGNRVHNILTSICNSTGGSGTNLNVTNAEVIGNEVYDNGPYPTACGGYVLGIYFLQAGGYAWNNIVFDNAGFGIQIWHTPSSDAIVNNTVFANASGGIVLGTDNSGFTVDYVTVNNNIVFNNSGSGIAEEGASSSSTGTHNVYMDNLVYQNSGASFSLQNGNVASGTVNAGPDFVDYTGDFTGIYQFQSGSPAIDVGTSNDAPAYDFDNVSRPQGSAWDIGAFEYVATPTATLSRSSLVFPSQPVGTTSPAETVTFTNSSGSALSISGISITSADSGNFGQTNNCGSSLAGGASCSINVIFTPTGHGSASGTLSVTDNAGGSPQSVSLSGSSQGRKLVLSAAPSVDSVDPGVAASYTLSVTSGDGSSIDSAVSLSCSGLPSSAAACSFTPSSVTPGTGTSVSTLTISIGYGAAMIPGIAHPDSNTPLLALFIGSLFTLAGLAAFLKTERAGL